jgi:hypothetical protein
LANHSGAEKNCQSGQGTTFRAQSFQLNPLTVGNKAFFKPPYHRYRQFRQTPRIAADVTGKVRVALCLCTVMGQLEMPGTVVQKGPVHETSLYEAVESPVDGNLI